MGSVSTSRELDMLVLLKSANWGSKTSERRRRMEEYNLSRKPCSERDTLSSFSI